MTPDEAAELQRLLETLHDTVGHLQHAMANLEALEQRVAALEALEARHSSLVLADVHLPTWRPWRRRR